MSLRISDARWLVLALLAGACDRVPADPRVAAGAVPADKADMGRIACRLGHAGPGYAPVCTAERAETGAGQMLTLRGPDGGFRRVLVDADGRGVRAADGAEPAVVTIAGGTMEIAVGGDRYRLPAVARPR